MNLDVFAAFLMGLAGAGHCLMMCGGLAGALGAKPPLRDLLSYNFGRLTSYAIAGALVGLFSQLLISSFSPMLIGLRFLAAFFLIALGCYFGGWWLGLRKLEALGRPLWRKIAPKAAQLTQYHRGKGALVSRFSAGMLWGWLPCGLVYSALSWAALSGSASSGALYMLVFGLGTLPAMLAFGWFSGAIQSVLKAKGFRQAMGVVMILYGCWVAVIALRQTLLMG
ncbi:sulfite exporter TauE/SafE family protein [Pseudidiomarina terrestris]|uniref:Sulfite exporter TauE/SafE family protein n=1 Tax=Pseudidiomarina terrestris TaxID=2820060 RepID=A0AAW7QVA0_9GAMM|nr:MULTISPECIES: sulfite exporter TauE/SafE family protein [unclassified Pseudidiomarina]MDN7123674.1 sulfite exporter TauE/SafE family protein [Pseudidiomarina sp. 1APP75-32.1]MDN7126536.1 sulfite exporter TauE/SafE family protein [Pseudidiomarina sp. 1APR75-33.1]MDN7135139.1 sulfite exporter TauE/SafE family protein [Pseudidiomarina sp. 1ASP75-5]MDN7137810.1 sulfite exporter TauE/SafE family protein [Pseudidiomarina sp. 1ASP75-14]MEA3587082.1 sulfite exporter TauE/SafE family protein [Pseudi